jgi:DNA-binding CsgD family transcriptional regulator
MILSESERRSLGQIFGLLAEGLDEGEIRARIGAALLDLLRADQFASFVWNEETSRFDHGLWINMEASNLARYDEWFQYRDPITFQLQARRHATAVSEVMPHAELERSEFFNDFLARDGLHWGINLHAFDGDQALGDLRIWRSRHRREFEPNDKALLDLIEPAFIAALRRCHTSRTAVADSAVRAAPQVRLSQRELQVARSVCRGLTDKQIARALDIGVASVRTYLQRIFDKTGVQRRAGLARLAEQLGLDDPD